MTQVQADPQAGVQTAEKTKLYEMLILMDQATVAAGLAGAIAHVQEILDRAEAHVLTLHKWEERRLAYPIKKQKRGTYLLALFYVQPGRIVNIERDCNLSEQVLRVMFLAGDHLGEVEIKQAVEAGKTGAAEAKLREEEREKAGKEGQDHVADAEDDSSDDDDA